MEDYTVKLAAFEGPMDLLMHLIEKNKIDIYDIPIAELTEQYMAYLEHFQEFNIDIASEFLVMAATLLQIKSRMMLPKAPRAEDDAEEEDPRQELVNRILEYRRFKQVSMVLDDMAETQGRYWAREPEPLPVHHALPEHLPLEALLDAFRTVLDVQEELVIPESIVAPDTYHVEDKMVEIRLLLARHGGEADFADVFSSHHKEELIVAFLALLELSRRKEVIVVQPRLFAAIRICRRNGDDGTDVQGKSESPA
jgi:segregation and condensation protein A